MKWKTREPRSEYDWHRWFAWRPVPIGDQTVWLQWVERRTVDHCMDYSFFECRLPEPTVMRGPLPGGGYQPVARIGPRRAPKPPPRNP